MLDVLIYALAALGALTVLWFTLGFIAMMNALAVSVRDHPSSAIMRYEEGRDLFLVGLFFGGVAFYEEFFGKAPNKPFSCGVLIPGPWAKKEAESLEYESRRNQKNMGTRISV